MAKTYTKVKYEIDLIEVLNRLDKPRQVKDKLRGLMKSRLFKQKFGENVIDKIANRTERRRVDKNNKPFKAPYSKSYQKSLEFKIYNKRPGHVNLKLTGEMLASMKLGKSGERKIKIIMADNFNNSKAHGHINGIKTKKGKVKRDFLGLPKDDENKMLSLTLREFSDDSIINSIDFENETLE